MLRFLLCAVASTAAVWLGLSTGTAHAGGCQPCTRSDECVAMFGEPAYCVRFSEPTGCGDLMQYCCPGQGCAATAEGPSCAPECEVVDGPATDAGPGGSDAGPGGSDAGPGGTDAGPGLDGGPVRTDSGPTFVADRGDRGCCTVAPGAGPVHAGLVPVVALLGAALFVRRRSRRRR